MYIDPNTVVAPKASWKLKGVIYNTKKGGWSVAEGEWEGVSHLGIRWNGSDRENGVGNPQSRGHATWFILPKELESAVRREIKMLTQTKGMFTCVIDRPDNYDLGVWRVQVTLSLKTLKHIGLEYQLSFMLPFLPYRKCLPQQGYSFRGVAGEERGLFVHGYWVGDVSSIGIFEAGNPSNVEFIHDAFVQNVEDALEKIST